MATDGNQVPAWTGQPFAHLMHKPAPPAAGYGAVPALATAAIAQPALRAATGVWDGPAPRGSQQARDAVASGAAETAIQAEPQPDSVLLPGGGRLPLAGFGTYKIDSVDAVRAALEAGYRHVDCARVYGNEALVGEALSPWIEQHGRDSVFVTSKVWNDAHQPAAARASAEASVADLRCGHLDLLLMHWPDAWLPGTQQEPDTSVTIRQTWEAMEEMVDAGLATYLGVSNFSVAQLEALLEHARVRPVVNQVELHPLLAQRKLVGVCLRKGVTCVAYGPLGRGKEGLLTHPEIEKIAKEAGKTSAQVLLRWNVQRSVAVIPKASSPEHMADNIEGLFDWRLSYDQKARIDKLDEGKRFVAPEWHSWGDPEEGGAAKASRVILS